MSYNISRFKSFYYYQENIKILSMCPNYIPQDNTFNHYLRMDFSLSVFPMFTIHGALMHINHKQKPFDYFVTSIRPSLGFTRLLWMTQYKLNKLDL